MPTRRISLYQLVLSVLGIGIGQPAASSNQLFIKGIKGKRTGYAGAVIAGRGEFLCMQINRHAHLALELEQTVQVIFGQFNRQDTAVEHVLPEDAGKALGNHHINAIHLKHPDRMLA